MSSSSSTQTNVPPALAAGSTLTGSSRRPSMQARFYRRTVTNALAPLQQGRLHFELPDGSPCEFGAKAIAPNPCATHSSAVMRVRRDAFFKKCFWAGDIGFAESYIDGDWDSADLTATIGFFIQNLDRAPTLSGSRRRLPAAVNLLRFANRLTHVLRPSTRTIARRNIRQHYDLSNEFFALWLDPSLMYSAAKWPAHAPQLSLEAAQREKNDALCRQLRLKPADRVLEIGTGWGGWSIHAAREYGCHVTTVTISPRQSELARQRVHAAGLTDRVDVQLRDFRDITGRFDKIVSIEMVEALGHRYQDTFAQVVAERLQPDGLLAMQFITCPDARYDELRGGVDFIQKHIFPGSLLLSLNRFNGLLAQRGGFVLHDMEDFGPDYARTLQLWRDRFTARRDEVRALGFDERFVRKWNYYLCYCEAAFASRNISVVHTLHTRANNRSLV